MKTGTVFDIKKFALHDGPGLRTTIFLKGCPLACSWCHNPEGMASQPHRIYRAERCLGCGHCVETCPQQALDLGPGGLTHHARQCVCCSACAKACPAEAVELIGTKVTVNQVLAEVEKDRVFYDESGGGVTFSGGEPLMQTEFLLALLEGCGKRELHRVVDTTGFAPAEVILKVARQSELLLYDLKHMDSQRHKALTGVPNERILANLQRLAQAGVPLWVRMPIIPGLNDDTANLGATGRFIAQLPGPPLLNILPFHGAAKGKYQRLTQTFTVAGVAPPTADQITAIARFMRDFGLPVTIGGESHDPACRATA